MTYFIDISILIALVILTLVVTVVYVTFFVCYRRPTELFPESSKEYSKSSYRFYTRGITKEKVRAAKLKAAQINQTIKSDNQKRTVSKQILQTQSGSHPEDISVVRELTRVFSNVATSIFTTVCFVPLFTSLRNFIFVDRVPSKLVRSYFAFRNSIELPVQRRIALPNISESFTIARLENALSLALVLKDLKTPESCAAALLLYVKTELPKGSSFIKVLIKYFETKPLELETQSSVSLSMEDIKRNFTAFRRTKMFASFWEIYSIMVSLQFLSKDFLGEMKFKDFKLLNASVVQRTYTCEDLFSAAYAATEVVLVKFNEWYKTGQLSVFCYDKENVNQFYDNYSKLSHLEPFMLNSTLDLTDHTIDSYYELLESTHVTAKRLHLMTTNALEKRMLFGYIIKLQEWKAAYTSVSCSGALRVAPFVMCFHGTTSVGKTFVSDLINSIVLNTNGFDADPQKKAVYNENDQYFETCRGDTQTIVFDDLMNTKIEMLETSPLAPLIKFANNTAEIAIKAALEEKGGVPIRPKTIYATTNVEGLNATLVSAEPLSIMRRFHFYATIKVKPQYATDARADSAKIKAYTDTLPPEEVMLADIYDIDLKEWYVRDNLSCGGRPMARFFEVEVPNKDGDLVKISSEGLSISQAIYVAQEMSKKHFAKENDLLQRMNKQHTILPVCKTCRKLQQYCVCKDVMMDQEIGQVRTWVNKVKERHINNLRASDMARTVVRPGYTLEHLAFEWEIDILTASALFAKLSEIKRTAVHMPEKERFNAGFYLQCVSTYGLLPPDEQAIVDEWSKVVIAHLKEELNQYTPDSMVMWLARLPILREFLYIELMVISKIWVEFAASFKVFTMLLTIVAGSAITMSFMPIALPVFAFSGLAFWYFVQARWNIVGTRYIEIKNTIELKYSIMHRIARHSPGVMTSWFDVAVYAGASAVLLFSVGKMLQMFFRDSTLGQSVSEVAQEVVAKTMGTELGTNLYPDVDMAVRKAFTPTQWAGVELPQSQEYCGEIDTRTTTDEMMFRIIEKNLVSVRFIRKDAPTEICNGLFVTSNILMIPKHVDIAEDQPLVIQRHDKLLNSVLTTRVSNAMRWESPSTDLAFVSVLASGDYKNISKYFPMQHFPATPAQVLYRTPNGNVTKTYTKASPEPEICVAGVSPYSGHTYHLEYDTFKGLCGAPLISLGTNKCLVGVHLAGRTPKDTFGACSIILQDEALVGIHYLRNIPSLQKSLSVEAGDDINFETTVAGNKVLSKGEVHYKCPTKHIPLYTDMEDRQIEVLGSCFEASTFRSEVRMSLISHDVERIMGCPQLWGPPKAEFETEPYYKALAGYGKASLGPSPKTLEMAIIDYTTPLLEATAEFTRHVPMVPLTPEETMGGIYGRRFIDPMPRNKSCGYGFKSKLSTHYELLDGVAELSDTLQQEIDAAMLCYRQNKRYNFIYKASLKDEPTLLTKKKIRVFTGAPVAQKYIIRKYFLPPATMLTIFSGLSEQAVGINASGREWDELHHHITQFGDDRIIAGDFKAYDQSLPVNVTIATMRILIAIAAAGGYSEDDLAIMEAAIPDVVSAYVAVNGTLVKLTKGNTSGNNLTVFINGIANALLHRCAYFDTLGLTASPYRENVVSMFYGDDSLGAVHSRLGDSYTCVNISEHMLVYGLEYTAPDKTPIIPPFRPKGEVNFLKRDSLYVPEFGTYNGLLDEKSIFKSLHSNLASKELTRHQLAAVCICGALREWFLYGRFVFDKRRKQLLEIVKKHDLEIHCDKIIYADFDQLLTDWREKYLGTDYGDLADIKINASQGKYSPNPQSLLSCESGNEYCMGNTTIKRSSESSKSNSRPPTVRGARKTSQGTEEPVYTKSQVASMMRTYEDIRRLRKLRKEERVPSLAKDFITRSPLLSYDDDDCSDAIYDNIIGMYVPQSGYENVDGTTDPWIPTPQVYTPEEKEELSLLNLLATMFYMYPNYKMGLPPPDNLYDEVALIKSDQMSHMHDYKFLPTDMQEAVESNGWLYRLPDINLGNPENTEFAKMWLEYYTKGATAKPLKRSLRTRVKLSGIGKYSISSIAPTVPSAPQTNAPTIGPTISPTSAPTSRPSTAPTSAPFTLAPQSVPTSKPTLVPTKGGTSAPTSSPNLRTSSGAPVTSQPTSAPFWSATPKTLQPQSGVEHMMSPTETDKTGIYDFAQGSVGHTVSVTGDMDDTFYEFDSNDNRLDNVFKRPVKIASYKWTPGVPFPKANISPHLAYITDKMINNKVCYFKQIKMKLCVKAVVSGSPMHYGLVHIAWHPLGPQDQLLTPTTTIRTGAESLVPYGALPHIYVDPSCCQAGEIHIPHFHHRNAYTLPTGDIAFSGWLYISEVIPLRHTGMNSDPIHIDLYAWAEEVLLAAPTATRPLGLQPQAGDEFGEGRISRPAAAVSDALSLLHNVPVIAPYATAAAAAAGAGAKVAKLMGYSTPSNVAAVAPVLHRPYGSWSNTDKLDPIPNLAFDSKQGVTIDPRVAGMKSDGCMSIGKIASTECILTSFDWKTTDAVDKLLFSIAVHPNTCVIDKLAASTPASQRVFHTPLSLIASHHKYWRGSIKYRFQVVTNALFRGRMIITYDPSNNRTLTTSTNIVQTEVIDISTQKDFVIECGWHSEKAYNRVPFPNNDFGAIMPGAPPLDGNGVLSIKVVNELAAPNSGDFTIAVVVSIAGGDDLSFGGYGNTILRGGYRKQLVGQSGPEIGDSEGNHTPTSQGGVLRKFGRTVDDRPEIIHFGDPVPSVLHWLKRYNFVSSPILTAPTGVGISTATFRVLPALPGEIQTGDRSAIVGTSALRRSASVPNTLATMLPCFAAIRGGFRHKYLVHGSLDSNYAGTMNARRLDAGAEFTTFNAEGPTGSNMLQLSWMAASPGEAVLHEPLNSRNNVLQVEVPYQCQERFASARQSPNGALNLGTVAVELRSKFLAGDIKYITQHVAVADDFSAHWFLGAPPFYQYIPTPPA